MPSIFDALCVPEQVNSVVLIAHTASYKWVFHVLTPKMFPSPPKCSRMAPKMFLFEALYIFSKERNKWGALARPEEEGKSVSLSLAVKRKNRPPRAKGCPTELAAMELARCHHRLGLGLTELADHLSSTLRPPLYPENTRRWATPAPSRPAWGSPPPHTRGSRRFDETLEEGNKGRIR
jgi:hypothetical protein